MQPQRRAITPTPQRLLQSHIRACERRPVEPRHQPQPDITYRVLVLLGGLIPPQAPMASDGKQLTIVQEGMPRTKQVENRPTPIPIRVIRRRIPFLIACAVELGVKQIAHIAQLVGLTRLLFLWVIRMPQQHRGQRHTGHPARKKIARIHRSTKQPRQICPIAEITTLLAIAPQHDPAVPKNACLPRHGQQRRVNTEDILPVIIRSVASIPCIPDLIPSSKSLLPESAPIRGTTFVEPPAHHML
ncbi:hypothetical protein HRbin15_02149 [bacterium HR15]|nr:hypothetical protein HRbin15_02149 [bacterium HR15]